MSGRIAFAALILGAGALWVLTAVDVLDLTRATWVGLLLIGTGAAIAFAGRRIPFVVLGIVVALAGVPALLVDDRLFEGGVGDSTERPESASELQPFHHAVGKLTVDLTGPDLELDEKTVEASIGAGELLVLVPENTDVTVDAHVWAGRAASLDETEKSGLDVDLTSISGTSGTQELTLELEAGAGNIRIERVS